jgi:hypothetical protein
MTAFETVVKLISVLEKELDRRIKELNEGGFYVEFQNLQAAARKRLEERGQSKKGLTPRQISVEACRHPLYRRLMNELNERPLVGEPTEVEILMMEGKFLKHGDRNRPTLRYQIVDMEDF